MVNVNPGRVARFEKSLEMLNESVQDLYRQQGVDIELSSYTTRDDILQYDRQYHLAESEGMAMEDREDEEASPPNNTAASFEKSLKMLNDAIKDIQETDKKGVALVPLKQNGATQYDYTYKVL